MLQENDSLSVDKWLNDDVVNAFLGLLKTNCGGLFDYFDPLYSSNPEISNDYLQSKLFIFAIK